MILFCRVLVNILEFFWSLNLRSYIILSFYPSTLYIVLHFSDSCSVLAIFPLIVNFSVAQGTHL